ncbi:MAG: DinB family protein [Ignavibacteriae bacterium]|nr:DinB family protein [Ignavibacteria bacterium]MBI3365207.1 DinB family protein [Ignavibacteriota bacterium]
MITQTNWIDRTFNFDFPAGLFPCILERVRGTPSRVKEMVQRYPRNIRTVRMNDGWSIQEHVGHLYDLDELHEGRIDDFLSGVQILRAADMTNRKTYQANHNANSIEAVVHSFKVARARFVQRLETLDDQQITLTAEHPRLKRPMRLVDMVFFVAEHDDHHLARMSALARVLQQRQ